ncbi:hypothetical protein OU800_21865 [Pseudomonas sp. GOM7]|uniref:hypothetical protein n=1 Tax=Pseudomonas sp. GOM7 TaxID=2998079 RepID=UPI00227B803E|nr:hypothetical protein [Pseudomonas sp. GOM7]WAJ37223.1 hypothetical protein OU800_21865 [Pseudomonas sp. GOM7]
MPSAIIHFQDHGQDFLRWQVDEQGVVTGCWPFQKQIWCGLQITNLSKLKAGELVHHNRFGEEGSIRYPVKAMIPLSPVEVTVRLDGDGYITSSVRGFKVSCTHSSEYPVHALARKLFPDHECKVEQLPCERSDRIDSKWLITPFLEGSLHASDQ